MVFPLPEITCHCTAKTVINVYTAYGVSYWSSVMCRKYLSHVVLVDKQCIKLRLSRNLVELRGIRSEFINLYIGCIYLGCAKTVDTGLMDPQPGAALLL